MGENCNLLFLKMHSSLLSGIILFVGMGCSLVAALGAGAQWQPSGGGPVVVTQWSRPNGGGPGMPVNQCYESYRYPHRNRPCLNGGICMKAPGRYVCHCIRGYAESCIRETNSYYYGNDIRSFNVKNIEACDEACLRDEKCVGFAFDQ